MADEDKPALRFVDVRKRYRMGGDLREKLLESLGLGRLLKRAAPRAQAEFDALQDVTFEVPRGRRYGIVGRNGAGKTTLLKLISGNFAPTAGRVEVNGSVQALMTLGHGFHPEYSGRDNIVSSLQYNGLSHAEFRDAVDDIIDFCELGPFIDQPFKVYSSGMQARLMFATATAVRPDILIVDEVLSAGDAYFIAKSKRRVERLVESGCTLLLVSHSMAQVLELCEQVIWMHGGQIRQMGPAFGVVKAYEEWMHGSIERLDKNGSGAPATTAGTGGGAAASVPDAPVVNNDDGDPVAARNDKSWQSRPTGPDGTSDAIRLQIPAFLPHGVPASLPDVSDAASRQMAAQAPGGISRWQGESGLRVVGVTISGPQGATDTLVSLQPANFSIFLEAETDGPFRCTYGIAVHDLKGRAFTRIWSPPDRFEATKGDGRRIDILLNPNQLGPGTYTLGISILGEADPEYLDSARRYDLLSRSFLFHVALPDSLGSVSADFFHSAEWTMRDCALAPPAGASLPLARALEPDAAS